MKIKEIFQKKWIKNIVIGVLPFCLIFFMQLIQLQSIPETCQWFVLEFNSVFVTYLLLGSIMYTLTAITNQICIGVLLPSILTIGVSIVSCLKLQIRKEVFLLTDFALIGNASEIAGFVEKAMLWNFAIIASVVFLILEGIFLFRVRKNYQLKERKRLLSILIPVFVLVFVFGSSFSQKYILPTLGVDVSIRFTPNTEYKNKGILLGMYIHQLNGSVQKPEDYTKANVHKILESIESLPLKKQKIKPNVIVIMNESFSDVTQIPNISYSRDPLPTVRKLQEEYTGGNFISSTFAGGTGNIEFELFTGNTLNFLPYGVNPFSDSKELFSRKLPTIQREFKQNGYKTLAIHSYIPDFYNRVTVYPALGFDEFISINEFENPTYDGQYVSDDFLTDEIIRQLERSDEPTFLFALSMQNHYPYSESYYDHESPIQVESDKLSEKSLDQWKAYVHGISDADTALKKLIDYLETIEEPTVVLFYGDHLPAIYDVYLESGYVSTLDSQAWTTEELYKVHKIPFCIYDNFDYREDYETIENIGAQFLGNYLMNYIDLPKSNYFKFLDTLEFKSIRDRLFIDKEDNILDKPTSQYDKQLADYRMLQYDILFGEQYSLEEDN